MTVYAHKRSFNAFSGFLLSFNGTIYVGGAIKMKKITKAHIINFKNHLIEEEKSFFTITKYIRDVNKFVSWSKGKELNKALVLKYKEYLLLDHEPSGVNSILSALNSFFVYCEWYELKVKTLKIQHQIFTSEEKELTKAEYEKLLKAALDCHNQRLYYLMQTICSTGIRVSELRFITVEALKQGQTYINCKGKMRMIILPRQLCKMLKEYASRNNIKKGSVFCTRTGKPLDRSNIWSDMKKLCERAGVEQSKVFPHNLRHLFARTYYSLQKDIVRLADILGHSNVNTTRIYTMETGNVHRMQIQKLGLLRC